MVPYNYQRQIESFINAKEIRTKYGTTFPVGARKTNKDDTAKKEAKFFVIEEQVDDDELLEL